MLGNTGPVINGNNRKGRVALKESLKSVASYHPFSKSNLSSRQIWICQKDAFEILSIAPSPLSGFKGKPFTPSKPFDSPLFLTRLIYEK